MADLRTVKISQIRENPVALRSLDRDDPNYHSLRDSIKTVGIMNPITVREKTDEGGETFFEVCDGLHRFSAALENNLQEMPVHVVTFDEAATLEAQIIGNMCKVDTKPIDYTRQLNRILGGNATMTLAELGAKIHQSPSWISGRLGLLKLHDDVQPYVNDSKISLPNAQYLAKLPRDEQVNYLDLAISQPTAEFGPTITARLKELRDAARQGREASGPSFTPVSVCRKKAELEAEAKAAQVGPSLVAQVGAKTAAEGFALAVQWVLSTDPNSVEAQKAKWEARVAQQEADKKRREEERAEKKAKEAAEALAAVKAKQEAK